MKNEDPRIDSDAESAPALCHFTISVALFCIYGACTWLIRLGKTLDNVTTLSVVVAVRYSAGWRSDVMCRAAVNNVIAPVFFLFFY